MKRVGIFMFSILLVFTLITPVNAYNQKAEETNVIAQQATQTTATKVRIFVYGWLAGEILNGIFKKVTGTTPAEITTSAIDAAINFAFGNIYGKPATTTTVSSYFSKTGQFLSCTGSCSIGGGGGGSWRISPVSE